MNNHFAPDPALDRTIRVCETSFSLCSEEFIELSVDFEKSLAMLEQRHSEIEGPQKDEESVSALNDGSFDQESFEEDSTQPFCFDVAGLSVEFEIDVRWI